MTLKKKLTAREEFLAMFPDLDTVEVATAKPEELKPGERFVIYRYLNGSFEVRAIQDVAERLVDSQRSAWWPKVFKAIVDGKYTKLSTTPDAVDHGADRTAIKAEADRKRDIYAAAYPDFEMPSTRKIEVDRYNVPVKIFETPNCHFCEIYDEQLYRDMVGNKAEAIIMFYDMVARGEVTKLAPVNAAFDANTSNMDADTLIKERDKYVIDLGQLDIHSWGEITLMDLHAWNALGSAPDLRPTHYVDLTHVTRPISRKFYFRIEQDFSGLRRHDERINHVLLTKQLNVLAVELLNACGFGEWLENKVIDKPDNGPDKRRLHLLGVDPGIGILNHSLDSMCATLEAMDFSRKGKKVTNAAGKEITHRAQLTTFSLTSINDITRHENVVDARIDNIDHEIEVDIGPWAFSTANRSGVKAVINTLYPGVEIVLYANPGVYPDVSLVQKITDVDYEALESRVGPQLHGQVFEPCAGVSLRMENATFRFVFE
jgi:hypothetical protein